jgi:Protein of unknown function (DUF1444)
LIEQFAMGLFDFFRKPLTPEVFARKLMKELRKAGVTQALTYDKASERILLGTGAKQRVINLTNFFREYLALPPSKRAAQMRFLVRMLQGMDQSVPSNFDEARNHLRPKLWVRWGLEAMRLQVEIDGGDASKFEIPEYAVGNHLVASLVYDRPDSMASVRSEQLQEWGVTYYHALEIARENLEQTQWAYGKIGEGFYSFMSGDNYDACRLLLPSRIEKLTVKGDLVAMVPNRDTLLVTGSDDEEGLRAMLDLAAKALEQPRPMSSIPLRREDDQWVDWLPTPEHPLSAQFRDLASRFFLEEYSDQKQLLDRLHEKRGEDIFVASYVLKKTHGTLVSYAVWGSGVKTLLPRSEWICFVRRENDIPTIARWEDAELLVSRLLQSTEYYPERFLVDGFPTDDELEKLGKHVP